jgi:hypothetical protein
LRVALRAATKATEQALDRGRVVHLTTIRDAHDEDGEAVVLDLVEDPILAHLEAPDALPTGARQQLGALWSRFGRKAIDRFDNPGARVARYLLELPDSARQEFDRVSPLHVVSRLQVLSRQAVADVLPRDSAGVGGIREGLPSSFEIQPVLEGLEELDVFHRDHGGELTPTPDEADPLAGVGHSVDQFGQSVACLANADVRPHLTLQAYEPYEPYTRTPPASRALCNQDRGSWAAVKYLTKELGFTDPRDIAEAQG